MPIKKRIDKGRHPAHAVAKCCATVHTRCYWLAVTNWARRRLAIRPLPAPTRYPRSYAH
jgi:hypothetical protein